MQLLIKLLDPNLKYFTTDDSCLINPYYDYCNDSLIIMLIPHLLLSTLPYGKALPFPFLCLSPSFCEQCRLMNSYFFSGSLLSLFILMLKKPQIWPVRASSNSWVFLTCPHHFLKNTSFGIC